MIFSINKYIKCVSIFIILTLFLGANLGSAVAQKFPNKPVQIVVPFKPGGGADRTFRLFAPYLGGFFLMLHR